MSWIKKPYRYALTFGLVISLFTSYVLLDTFVIPQSYTVVDTSNSSESSSQVSTVNLSSTAAVVSTNTYQDENISITITEYREYETSIYVADITISDISLLQSAFANDTYGKNIKATSSSIAESVNAILAINGDFYGARTSGYVIRNGVLYRDTMVSSDQEDLVIYADGSFEIITEGSISAQSLLDNTAVQVLSFGPGLISNGTILVDSNDEVDQSMTSNPRTAIGIIDANHYVFVVSDGRTSASTGLTLLELATFMESLGVSDAYNLDGGGSSTMVFNGTVVNNPTTNGKTISERSVSDIVYIGY